jgi:hypothetical protein
MSERECAPLDSRVLQADVSAHRGSPLFSFLQKICTHRQSGIA